MAKRGRPRKQGARTKSGRLSRAVAFRIDRGNSRAEAKFGMFGTNGSDAIGRAYERGLMGGGQDAKAMLDTARAVFRAYWAWYVNGAIRCPLSDRNGAASEDDAEREARQESWLCAMLALAGRDGHRARALFDQLVIDIHPDDGPAWLDRILDRKPIPGDWDCLTVVLDILADCAGVERRRKSA